ncbi:hypothetical protein Tco_0568228 [Tanacetum coccineum]
MDDEPMGAADRVVTPTPGSATTIPETANEFAIKGNHLTLVNGNQFYGRIKTDPHKHIHEFLGICDMFKYRDTKNEAVRLMMFPLSLTVEAKTWLDELNEGTIETWDEPRTDFISRFSPQLYLIESSENEDEEEESTPQPKNQTQKPVKETPIPKPYKPEIPYLQRLKKEKIEAQYGKFLDMIQSVRINVPLVDDLAGMPNYGKFLKELVSNKHKLEQISSAFLSDESSAMSQNKVSPKHRDPESFLIPCSFSKAFSCNVKADLGASINLMPYSLYAKLSLETFKPNKISGTLLEDKLFAEFNEFMAMNIDENSESKPESEPIDIPFKKITFNIDYKIKTSLEEPPLNLELKQLLEHLEYVLLEEPTFLPIIISS